MAKCKYIWSDKDFDEWIKKQQDRAKENGLKTSSSGITKLLMNVVIVPNKLNLFDKPKPKKIKIKI